MKQWVWGMTCWRETRFENFNDKNSLFLLVLNVNQMQLWENVRDSRNSFIFAAQ